MKPEDPTRIAERLSLPQEAVAGVQRRGFLRRLDIDDAEIRERLWRGHVAFARRRRWRSSSNDPRV